MVIGLIQIYITRKGYETSSCSFRCTMCLSFNVWKKHKMMANLELCVQKVLCKFRNDNYTITWQNAINAIQNAFVGGQWTIEIILNLLCIWKQTTTDNNNNIMPDWIMLSAFRMMIFIVDYTGPLERLHIHIIYLYVFIWSGV